MNKFKTLKDYLISLFGNLEVDILYKNLYSQFKIRINKLNISLNSIISFDDFMEIIDDFVIMYYEEGTLDMDSCEITEALKDDITNYIFNNMELDFEIK